jgi:cell division protein FtsL
MLTTILCGGLRKKAYIYIQYIHKHIYIYIYIYCIYIYIYIVYTHTHTHTHTHTLTHTQSGISSGKKKRSVYTLVIPMLFVRPKIKCAGVIP